MNSIRARLLATLLLGLALVMTAGGAAIYAVARAGLVHQFDDGLLARARTLAALVKREPEHLVFEAGDAPHDTLEEIWFELRDVDGQSLKRSSNLVQASLPRRAPGDDRKVIERLALPGGVDGRALTLGFRPRIDPDDWKGRAVDDRAAESLTVTVAMSDHALDDALRVLAMSIIGAGLATALAAATLVTLGVRWSLRPLDRLSAQVAGVSGARMAQRLIVDDPPRELAPICVEVNALLDRVERTVARERSFIDAAAHELRTPLAELRAATDVALMWPEPHRVAATVQEAQVIGLEMERLVEALLAICRARGGDDPSPQGEQARPIDIAGLIRARLAHAVDRIRDHQLRVDMRVPDDARLLVRSANDDALDIIVRNLVDNAISHTPRGGEVIALIDDDGALVIQNGPVSLNAGDLPRMFEPFWRQDGARSDRRHAGLGLTVVRQLAASCGLVVTAQLAGDRLRMLVQPADAAEDGARRQAKSSTAEVARSNDRFDDQMGAAAIDERAPDRNSH